MASLQKVYRIAGVVAVIMAVPAIALAQQSIGHEFQGVWEPTSSDQTQSCSDNDYDIRIEVFVDRIEMHEGLCRFQDIIMAEPSDRASGIQVVLACAEEGSFWIDRQRWQLQNGELLISGLAPGNAFDVTYRRCPDSVLRSPWAGAAPQTGNDK